MQHCGYSFYMKLMLKNIKMSQSNILLLKQSLYWNLAALQMVANIILKPLLYYFSVVQPCRHSPHVATSTFNVATSKILRYWNLVVFRFYTVILKSQATTGQNS